MKPQNNGPWRCPICGGQVLDEDRCPWPAKNGRLWEQCPGTRPASRAVIVGRIKGRGIGNPPPRRD